MPKRRAPSRSLTIRVPTDLYTRLQICVLEKQREGDGSPVSATQIVHEALETYLIRHQRKTQRKTLRQTRKAAHG